MPQPATASYRAIMVINPRPHAIATFAALLCGFGVFAGPAQATGAQARLVHCDTGTCLRLSGHRSGATTAIRIGESDLAVAGERAWQATVPLSTARTWPISRGYSLRMTLADAESGVQRVESVMLPPGALGSRTELVSLLVSGR
jgi:hypothetical protein